MRPAASATGASNVLAELFIRDADDGRLDDRRHARTVVHPRALRPPLDVVMAGVDHFDGRGSDAANALVQAGSQINLHGVVVAGVVLGALGALTDTAVTQASAVMALRRADATLSARRLYTGAFVIGRDHLSATVHTLVLAYVGATLPFLLALHETHTPLADALSGQQLAEPVVATLIGTLALLSASR